MIPPLADDPSAPFPPVERAAPRPNGLLAWGGDLSVARLLNAYSRGIFPWYSQGEPILWWSPDPRMVLPTDGVRLSRRFRRTLRALPWRVVADRDFAAVIARCADKPRPGQGGTWITREMRAAYIALHRAGHAHSIEVRDGDDRLLGGVYGVAIGAMFFGESMFSDAPSASQLAIAALARALYAQGCPLIDGQVESAHLRRLGGVSMPRADFVDRVAGLAAQPAPWRDWRSEFPAIDAAQMSAG